MASIGNAYTFNLKNHLVLKLKYPSIKDWRSINWRVWQKGPPPGSDRVNESLTFNDSIQPITLPTDDISNISTSFENKENIANQFTYHVAGWGLTATVNGAMLENKEDFMKNFQELQENAKIAIRLRELELETSKDDSCFEYYDHLHLEDKELQNLHITCAQSFKPLEEGACHGDSGSPLMKIDHVSGRAEVIGVTSEKSSYTCNKQAFYTRVHTYLPWINQNLKEFDPKLETHLYFFLRYSPTILKYGRLLRYLWMYGWHWLFEELPYWWLLEF